MTNQTAAKPVCEHYWASHVHDGLSVRLCQLCHEPDWDNLRAELAKAAAAERERLRTEMPTGVIRIEGGELSETEVNELAEKFRAAWRKGDYTILPDDTEERIAKAAAAQRERDAQLAESVGASYPFLGGINGAYSTSDDPVSAYQPFAALLRQGHAAGGDTP